MMVRLSGRALWIVFVFVGAVLALIGIAVAADWTTSRYASSEYWVSHTQIAQTKLTDLRADLLSAEAARLAFVSSGDERELPVYVSAMQQVPEDLDELKRLTSDDPRQQQRIGQLRPLIEQRLGLLRESVELAKSKSGDREQQEKLTESGVALTQQIRTILDQAEDEERLLHKQRQTISDETYAWTRIVLTAAFVAAMLIIAAIFLRLLNELRERQQIEQTIRQLSGRLLRVQDDERRRIARELHDSLGQLLTSLKMNLDHLISHPPKPEIHEQIIETCIEVAQQSLDETRTLSYLLHPPLLDEFGFASAAKWYIDGFAKRSRIEVKFEIARDFGRIPEELELVLFRVLQESLTNIHRHSGSSTAEIRVERAPGVVTLAVTDHGKGISAGMLETFRRTRGGVGVGLAGMRERLDEIGGKLEIRSEGEGTVLIARIPLPKEPANRPKIDFMPPAESRGGETKTKPQGQARAAGAL
jgi:signal transduction histidine kinase